MNKILIIIMALSIILAQTLSIPVYAVDRDILWDRYLELYKRTADLGRKGVNVSSIVDELSIVLELIENEDDYSLNRANELLDSIEEEISSLKMNADNILLMENLRKYSVVGALLSIPLLFYLLFPRLYLAIWFRVRRRWIVEK
mgnify:CR=1 FL=1